MKSACLGLLLLCAPAAAKQPTKAPAAPEAIVGVGLVVKIEKGWPVVDSLVPGGPAAKDGRLQPGDRIEAVAQGDDPWERTSGMKLAEIVARIRGPRGSKIALRVSRPGEDGERRHLTVELKRDVLRGAKDK